MTVFKMLILFVFVALCGSVSESLWMSEGLYEEVVPRKLQKIIDQGERFLKMEEAFRTQMFALAFNMSQKLDNFIREVNENDVLQSCELPVDKSVVSTVVGSRIYKKPKFIRKGYSAFYRCKDPGSYVLVGGSPNEKCLGADRYETVIDRRCIQLKNETYWQSANLQLELYRTWCRMKASNMSDVSVSNPLSHASYLRCEHFNEDLKNLSMHTCSYNAFAFFDENSQECISYTEDLYLSQSGLKPSIIVNATNSTWDIMGWLLVEKGSNVTLECLYPSVQNVTEVVWKKTEMFAPSGVEMSSLRISDYRNRIQLNDIDSKDTGIYTCVGKSYNPLYHEHLETISHEVVIAIKGEECALVPLPDFDLHQEYYRRYPIMNRVRRRCLETGNEKKKDFFTDGVKALKIYV